jgi:hypothetical protein
MKFQMSEVNVLDGRDVVLTLKGKVAMRVDYLE